MVSNNNENGNLYGFIIYELTAQWVSITKGDKYELLKIHNNKIRLLIIFTCTDYLSNQKPNIFIKTSKQKFYILLKTIKNFNPLE